MAAMLLAFEVGDMQASDLPLPPGDTGLPLVGETLSFVRNPFAWVDERVARFGRVFRSSVLGRDIIVIAGPEGNELWIDQDKLARDGAMFDHVFGLFGGYSLPTLDGSVHRRRKEQVMAGFGRAALESYMPGLQETIEQFLAKWEGMGELRWIDELRRLAIAGIARNMLGLTSAA